MPFANFEGILGFSIPSIILVKAGYASHNQGNMLDHPAWLRMTLDCSRIVKEIAMVSGFLSEEGGRRRRCFVLESDKNKKDQKNLRSKLI